MTGISATGALLAAGLHAAAGGSGFSRAVAGTGPVFLAFLAIHIPAGLARGLLISCRRHSSRTLAALGSRAGKVSKQIAVPCGNPAAGDGLRGWSCGGGGHTLVAPFGQAAVHRAGTVAVAAQQPDRIQ